MSRSLVYGWGGGGDIAYSYGLELDKMVADGKVTQQKVIDVKQKFGKLLRRRIYRYPKELRSV